MSNLGGRPMSEFTDREEADLRVADAVLTLTKAEAVASTAFVEGGTVFISDRSHGKFVATTGQSPNTFNIIAMTGTPALSLVLVIDGYPNAIEAGAIGDGIADDVLVLESLLTQFKIVRVPAKKVCLIAANLDVPSDDCTIIGDGINSGSKILFSGNNRRIQDQFNDFTLRDIEIDGNKPNVIFETANNTDYGILTGEGLALGSQISGLRVFNVRFRDIGLDGIRLDNISNVHIDESCVFENCRRWGVTVIPTNNPMDDLYIAGHYDSSFGGAGSDFPLGAVDVEPNVAHPTISLTNIRYGNIYTNKAEVSALDKVNEGLDVNMSNVHVEDAFVRITSNKYSLSNVTIAGDEGYFRADIFDSRITEVRDLDIRFINSGRTPLTLTGGKGRKNLIRADYGDQSALGITPGVAGTGSVSKVTQDVDGHEVSLTSLKVTTGTGNAVLTHTAAVTITAGDQVLMYLEVDRIDGTAESDPVFEFKIGAAGEIFTARKVLPQGISTVVAAINSPQNLVTPAVSFGVTGTFSSDVEVRVRKCFLYINPEHIDSSSLIIKPFSKQDVYTGTGTGFTGTPTGDVSYTRKGNIVTLTIASGVFTGTSNSTLFTITGAPLEIRPLVARAGLGRGEDNGSGLTSAITLDMGTNGTITLSSDTAGGTWTASGIKALLNTTFSYDIE